MFEPFRNSINNSKLMTHPRRLFALLHIHSHLIFFRPEGPCLLHVVLLLADQKHRLVWDYQWVASDLLHSLFEPFALVTVEVVGALVFDQDDLTASESSAASNVNDLDT